MAVGCCLFETILCGPYLQFLSPLYKAFTRPHLECAIQASTPILSCDAGALKKVQKLAVTVVKGLQYAPSEAALQQLRLLSLTHRRIRGDSIYIFKVTQGLLEFPTGSIVIHPTRATRPHQQRCCTHRRQHAFGQEVDISPLLTMQRNLYQAALGHRATTLPTRDECLFPKCDGLTCSTREGLLRIVMFCPWRKTVRKRLSSVRGEQRVFGT